MSGPSWLSPSTSGPSPRQTLAGGRDRFRAMSPGKERAVGFTDRMDAEGGSSASPGGGARASPGGAGGRTGGRSVVAGGSNRVAAGLTRKVSKFGIAGVRTGGKPGLSGAAGADASNAAGGGQREQQRTLAHTGSFDPLMVAQMRERGELDGGSPRAHGGRTSPSFMVGRTVDPAQQHHHEVREVAASARALKNFQMVYMMGSNAAGTGESKRSAKAEKIIHGDVHPSTKDQSLRLHANANAHVAAVTAVYVLDPAYVTADSNGMLKLWSSSLVLIFEQKAHKGSITSLTACSGHLFSAGLDGDVVQWDATRQGTLISKRRAMQIHPGGVAAMAKVPGQARIATSGLDNRIRLIDTRTMAVMDVNMPHATRSSFKRVREQFTYVGGAGWGGAARRRSVLHSPFAPCVAHGVFNPCP